MRAAPLRPVVAVLLLAAGAGACGTGRPTPAPAPARPGEPPVVSLWSSAETPSGVGSLSSQGAWFSTDRDAYAAAFEVDRTGRVRVVFPDGPNDDGRVKAGDSYFAQAPMAGLGWGVGFASASTARRVPFVFVVTSDRPLDLSRFAQGRQWSRQVRLQGEYDPEDVIERLAPEIARGGQYDADFAFVPPRLGVQAQRFVANCARVAQFGARDYWYFRDLWAVFSPDDWTFGAPDGWQWSGMLPGTGVGFGTPYWFARAGWATSAFSGACGSGLPTPRLQWGPILFGFPQLPIVNPQAPITIPPDEPGPREVPPDLRVPRIPTDQPQAAPAAAATRIAAIVGRGTPGGTTLGSEAIARGQDGPAGLRTPRIERWQPEGGTGVTVAPRAFRPVGGASGVATERLDGPARTPRELPAAGGRWRPVGGEGVTVARGRAGDAPPPLRIERMERMTALEQRAAAFGVERSSPTDGDARSRGERWGGGAPTVRGGPDTFGRGLADRPTWTGGRTQGYGTGSTGNGGGGSYAGTSGSAPIERSAPPAVRAEPSAPSAPATATPAGGGSQIAPATRTPQ